MSLLNREARAGFVKWHVCAITFAAAGFAAAAFAAGAAAGLVAAGFGAAGVAATGATPPGFALAAAKISAMLMPLPPGVTLPPAGALGEEAGSAALTVPCPPSPVSSAAGIALTSPPPAGAPAPLAFSALAAARISSTDIFLAINPPVNAAHY